MQIYGPKAVIDRRGGEFSASVSARALAFYEEYFDVPYSMQKMDSVAVPGFPYVRSDQNTIRRFIIGSYVYSNG